ncbi:MAG: hypothetical protein AAGA87_16675 [Pseudomonadota bacterium]
MLRFAPLVAAVTLAACSSILPPAEPEPEAIGDFRLGFNLVVADGAQQAAGSGEVEEDRLASAVRAALEQRLGGYDGDGLYHLGVRIEGYTLGEDGTSDALLLLAVNVWEDATQEKLNETPLRVSALNPGNSNLEAVAAVAAGEVDALLRTNAGTWFAPKEGRERVPFTRDPLTGQVLEPPAADQS